MTTPYPLGADHNEVQAWPLIGRYLCRHETLHSFLDSCASQMEVGGPTGSWNHKIWVPPQDSEEPTLLVSTATPLLRKELKQPQLQKPDGYTEIRPDKRPIILGRLAERDTRLAVIVGDLDELNRIRNLAAHAAVRSGSDEPHINFNRFTTYTSVKLSELQQAIIQVETHILTLHAVMREISRKREDQRHDQAEA
ncbi:MAG: hypothetical protein F4Y88_02130 [Chloroflexi bacterium]|nr:hypothetical protein [Chloroflexota bacterium]